MKKNILLLTVLAFALCLASCGKDDDEGNSPLAVETTTITDVSYTSAIVSGEIVQGSASQRGICWGTSANPTVNGSKVEAGSGKGMFSATITGLSEGETYYFRAYGISGSDVAYGETKQCRTYEKGAPGIAIISTEKTPTSITCKAKIVFDGGVDVQKRGICWSTTPEPAADLPTSKEEAGEAGSFISTIAGLSPETLYYIRPYAVYAGGTTYGTQAEVTTPALVEDLRLTGMTNSAASSSISGTFRSKFSSQETVTIEEQGIVYSTTNNPTLEDGIVAPLGSVAQGAQPFEITGLNLMTDYYVRAYAKTTEWGVYYSNPVSSSILAPYDYYLGEWTLNYTTSYGTALNPPATNRTLTVSFVEGATANTYYLKGLLTDADDDAYNIIVNYNPADASISISGQIIGKTSTNYDFWFLPWMISNTGGASSARNTTYGVVSTDYSTDSDGKLKFKLRNNGEASTPVAGFALRHYDGSTSKANINGKGGVYQFLWMDLAKKQ
ncbi:MAG: hypothetical protein LBR26_06220 [Prevotella sp.]|jgi:hypothetical protein|nr:hypothetical protein [Prevotella sp.]